MSKATTPLDRYERATTLLAECETQRSALADDRARALAELQAAGQSLASIAVATGLTRSRVQQLVERGRTLGEKE